jgi:hypothetical protein
MMQISGRVARVVAAISLSVPMFAAAQVSTLKVVGGDSVAIPFAWVSVEGGTPSITDERGQVSLGATRKRTLTVEVRRIGFQPWFGKLTLPDTAAVFSVMLPRITQQLEGVTVTGERVKTQLELSGFYDRMLMRQKGLLTATFIGPEELDRRHPSRTTDMLYGLNGVSMQNKEGKIFARGIGGMCYMTVLLDGNVLCPEGGCYASSSSNSPSISALTGRNPQKGVDINQYLDANDVSAIEVYARGGNMPVSLQAFNSACGVIAIWTGPRK